MDRYSTLRNGLVGAWCPSLGATGYTLLDRSGRQNNGTLVNMDSNDWSASGSGVSLNFDGTNNFVRVPNNLSFIPRETGFTLSTWLNAPATNQFGLIAQIRMADGGITNVVAFGVGGDTLNGTTGQNIGLGLLFNSVSAARWSDTSQSVLTGRWQHVCAVWNGTDAQIFVDGVSRSLTSRSNIGSVSTLALTGPLRIGTNVESGGSFLNGRLDDFRIYNRALTASEISILASCRGIGLIPMRHRRGSALSQFWTRVAGEWKRATPWINVGGTWKKSTPKINVSGTWKG